MKILCPAKINLRLKVEGRRADGYHLLSMLNILCDLNDEIVISKRDDSRIEIKTDADLNLSSQEQNHIYKAADKFRKLFAITDGFTFKLIKNIPPGAGLGGGSSDAAGVLAALYSIYKDQIDLQFAGKTHLIVEQLSKLALEIGSDVPFFFSTGSAIINGIGEVVKDVDLRCLSQLEFLLLLPEDPISTATIYEKLRNSEISFSVDDKLREFGNKIQSKSLSQEQVYPELLGLVENDLQKLSCECSEQLSEIFERLDTEQDLVCSMSGSGSSIFVLSRSSLKVDKEQAERISASLIDLPVRIRKTRIFMRESAQFAS